MKLHRAQLLLLTMAGILAVLVAVRVGAGTTGTVSGVVKDAAGKPLAGANVVIGKTNLSTVTDVNGRFVITNVPPGEYEIRTDMVGYADQAVDGVLVTMDTVSPVDFVLSEEAIQETTVVVTRARPMVDTRTANTLNLLTSQQEPLTRQDPASLRTAPGILSSLPGVIVEADGSGQMHLRGGKSDQIGWYVEGIPLTDPNTGQFGTNLFTTGIGKFQMYTGGFGAEYGNAISGVLNEVKKTGAAAPGFLTNIEDGSDAFQSLFVEYGGGEGDGFNYYAASSLLQSNLSGPMVKELEYADNVLKLVWPSANNTITLLGMQGSQVGLLEQSHTLDAHGSPVPEERDFMRQRFGILGLTWNRTFSPTSFMILQPYYQFSTSIGSAMGGSIDGAPTGWDTWSVRTGLQARYSNELNDTHSLKLGGSVLKSNNNFYYNALGFAEFESDTPTLQTDLFVEDQISLSNRWIVTPGVRYESIKYNRSGGAYVPGSGYSGATIEDVTESRLTPRLGTSYALDSRTAWKANWGRYTKFVPASAVQMTYADPDAAPFGPEGPTLEQMMPGLGSTAPQKSTNMELSYERQASETIATRLTYFRNDFENLSEYANVGGMYQYTNLGAGESSGVELYVRKKMSDGWQGWLSYTYQTSQSNRADLGLTGAMYDTSWDQRHTVALVTELARGPWSHSLRVDAGSGRQGLTSDTANVRRADPYAVFSYNLSLDLPEGSRIGDSAYLSIYNLFNSGQALQYRWNGTDHDEYAWMSPRFISLGVSRSY